MCVSACAYSTGPISGLRFRVDPAREHSFGSTSQSWFRRCRRSVRKRKLENGNWYSSKKLAAVNPVMRSGLGILFLSASFLLGASAGGRNDVFVSTANVSFQILSEEKSYGGDDVVRLNYRITNVSKTPLYVPREWEAT